jgi:hypothetical protein
MMKKKKHSKFGLKLIKRLESVKEYFSNKKYKSKDIQEEGDFDDFAEYLSSYPVAKTDSQTNNDK